MMRVLPVRNNTHLVVHGLVYGALPSSGLFHAHRHDVNVNEWSDIHQVDRTASWSLSTIVKLASAHMPYINIAFGANIGNR